VDTDTYSIGEERKHNVLFKEIIRKKQPKKMRDVKIMKKIAIKNNCQNFLS